MERKYININGEYGLTHSGPSSWASTRELLAEMDRLGIWQTVLECVGATNSLYRAKTLLKDIAKLDCPSERIIPCFSIEPGLLVQTGAMDEMIDILKTHRPCCVSLRPASCSYTLRGSETILEKISVLNPVVLIQCTEIKNKDKGADDLVWLAHRFPNMRFVLRLGNVQSWPFLFDVMSRTDNVYMDAAKLLAAHGIELACKQFGSHRVLFGQPMRSGNGASMGAIEYAQISEEDKEKIRCRNFIDLFADPGDRQMLTANLKAVDDRVQNSLWKPFMNGQGVKDAEVYDVHTHLGYTASYGYVQNLTFESQIAQFETDMERFNIQKVVSAVTGIPHPIPCHQEKEAAVKGKEDRLKGYIRYNPNFEEIYTDEYMAQRFATGYYVGLKTLPKYMGTDIRDKKYERMFQYAHDHHLPILIHTGSDDKGNPLLCAQAAERWPNAKVILGHSGCNDTGRAMCEKIAQDPRYQNIYFEYCATFLCERSTWKEALEKIDYRRVLFGTDAPIHSQIWELARLLSEDIPEEQLRAILAGNAKRLFGF